MWGGKAADQSIDRTLIISLSVLILVLLAFTVLTRWPMPAAVAILIWGIASFALVPPLQMRVMEAAKDVPNLASAVNIGAFNFGNAIGAALGGAVINAGLGLLMVLGFAWRSRGRRRCAGRISHHQGLLWGHLHFISRLIAIG